MKKIPPQADPNQGYQWNAKFSMHSSQRSEPGGIAKALVNLPHTPYLENIFAFIPAPC